MSDFFNEAYHRARGRFTAEEWLVLAPQQVTRAIYDAMHELDAAKASKLPPARAKSPRKSAARTNALRYGDAGAPPSNSAAGHPEP